ncbi:type II toxin-antitoxin system HicA family toxin [Paludisphaera borealis]|uniref:type II toxin-antitoxin system HicA family toxin n=1 Tax=Paludisphaera borealis TaxID=1387353 RepID=UPI0035A3A50A
MKRVDLIKAIEGLGCELVRHGAKHDWYKNPATGMAQAVPRHREINERLANRIVRVLGGPGDHISHGDA